MNDTLLANSHCRQEKQFERPKVPTDAQSGLKADMMIAALEETHEILWQNLLEAQTQQSKYAGWNKMTFKTGDKVWPSNKNICMMRPCKKLKFMSAGLYTVSKIIIKNAYKVDLPKTM